MMLVELPEEIIAYILSFLKKYHHIGNASRVCKLWSRLSWAMVSKLSLRKFPKVLDSDVFVPLLQKVPYASFIQLPSNATDFHLLTIADNLPHLKVLNLRRCRDITNAGIQNFHLKALHEIYLSTSWNISDLDFLTESYRTLLSLELRGCDLLTDSTFESLYKKTPEKFHNVAYLDVRDCKLLTDRAFRIIVEMMPNLIHLDVSGCPVTAESIESFTKLKKLDTLLLWGCDQLTDNSLKFLSIIPRLERVNLIDCDLISDHGLLHLSKSKGLASLELGSIGLTNRGIDHIFKLRCLKELSILSSTLNLTRDDIQKSVDNRKPEITFQYVQLAM